MIRETVYCDYAGGRWEWFTYSDGQRVYLSERTARRMLRGNRHNVAARLVNAAPVAVRQPFYSGGAR